jgi:hypothetical protein
MAEHEIILTLGRRPIGESADFTIGAADADIDGLDSQLGGAAMCVAGCWSRATSRFFGRTATAFMLFIMGVVRVTAASGPPRDQRMLVGEV